jgi:hypothetical protein
MGLLGPVGDPEVMAANILEVWNSDPRAIGARGREHVSVEFSWAHSMDVLFGEVVPAALARRATALGGVEAARAPSLARA